LNYVKNVGNIISKVKKMQYISVIIILLVMVTVRYYSYDNTFNYHTLYDNNGVKIIQNQRDRRIIFRDNLVYKLYKNTTDEVKNHTNIQNIINDTISYDGAKIPKLYYSDVNTIVFEHIGNISYTDWIAKLNSEKNKNSEKKN
jgi:hypothetical protein